MNGQRKVWLGPTLLMVLSLACGSNGQITETAAPQHAPTDPAASGRDGRPPPRGKRQLGLAVNETPQVDFGTAFALAQDVGLDFVTLTVFWDDVESEPGVFDPDPNWLAVANEFYGERDVALALVVAPVDTNVLRVPPDLRSAPLDDPGLIDRYLAALDYSLDQLTDVELVSVSIGNEVDAYLSADPNRWSAYSTLYERAADHVRTRAPDASVGVKATYSGLTGAHRAELQRLNEASDAILVTYYPLRENFQVEPPNVFGPDMKALLELYPGQPLHLLEVGYPSSPILSSSEERQAKFIRQVFREWDRHPQRTPVLNFIWMHDITQAELDGYANYYGSDDERFLAFLGSLGLRSADGQDKLGFEALRQEAAGRGW